MSHTLCKILIVDDEYIIRQGIEYILDWEKEGFLIVGEASNGEEALAKIEELHPDIVLSDIVMPKLDGIDLTRVIQQKYPTCKVIILSSYSDFEYVKNTFQHGVVDYILKPALSPEHLLAVLKKAAASIPSLTIQSDHAIHLSTQLSQYLLGFSTSLHQQTLDSDFPEQHMYVFMTSLKFYKDTTHVKTLFQEKLFTEKKQLHPCIMQLPNDCLVALLNTQLEKAEVQSILTTFIETDPTLKEEGFFVLSNAFDDITTLKQVYEEHIAHLRNRFYFQHVSFYEEQTPNKEAIKFDQRQYNAKLDMLQLNEAITLLMDYIKEVIAKQAISEGELKSFTGNALYTLIGVLEEHELNEESVRHFKLNCINLLESAVFAQDFMTQLCAICEDFQVIFKNYELDQNSNQIMQYLYDHFDQPITLQHVADRFGFSYHYLSTYFSTQSKETFIECLNRIRIEKACDLLNQSGSVISEVGSAVGYSDHSYFCKVFKKQTGMTPSEYKKR